LGRIRQRRCELTRKDLTMIISAVLATTLIASGGPAASSVIGKSARVESVRSGVPVGLTAKRPAVVERRILGYSTEGRPIKAWRLGEPGKRTYLVMSTMHGDERRTRQIAAALRNGKPISGIDLWVIPVYNPDGYANNTRKNGRGVDLNRNFPYRWADLDGNYESGPSPSSEPETRAMMDFLTEIKPRRIVSFHQPLKGVDVDTKRPRFARRLARALKLPRTSLTCGGVCHGTMTSWYNARFKGAALTVEYGVSPSRHRMRVRAPRAVLRVLGGRR
ncbi:MAG: M14 family zinc carboxypeptidase, partial [Nocardioides sp.]